MRLMASARSGATPRTRMLGRWGWGATEDVGVGRLALSGEGGAGGVRDLREAGLGEALGGGAAEEGVGGAGVVLAGAGLLGGLGGVDGAAGGRDHVVEDHRHVAV